MSTAANYIPIELEGRVYNLVADVEEVLWRDKQSEDDLTGFYEADAYSFLMHSGDILVAFKDELDRETLEYIYQFVDPM